jgi:hypothetical protein
MENISGERDLVTMIITLTDDYLNKKGATYVKSKLLNI